MKEAVRKQVRMLEDETLNVDECNDGYSKKTHAELKETWTWSNSASL